MTSKTRRIKENVQMLLDCWDVIMVTGVNKSRAADFFTSQRNMTVD